MNQENFLELLKAKGFPSPIWVVRDQGRFINSQSLPFEILALVAEGQIDIMIQGIKNTYLKGDVFYLAANQLFSQYIGSKGVKYLASQNGAVLQKELALEIHNESSVA